MTYSRLILILAIFGGIAGIRVWLNERSAKNVFPASQAALLLQPGRRLVHRPAQMVDAFGVRPGDRVLELGPGPGYFTGAAATAVGRDGVVIAADLQPAMLSLLLGHIELEAAERTRAVVCEATRLPFADGAFDAAFLVTVLGEIPEPTGALSELNRVLRAGGVVSFAEHLGDPDYVREGTLRSLCSDVGLQFLDRRRQPLGYIMRFVRSRA
jgi:ubiquinone/menaquinone biosynthesis C-methylase UbiE